MADTEPADKRRLIWCWLNDNEWRELKMLALKLDAGVERLVTEILREAIAQQGEEK